LVVVAVDILDPGNVGAIVRVAEAAAATGLVAAGACADPFGWKALRGSMGSAFRLPIVAAASVADAVATARERGCRIVATVPRRGRSLYDATLAGALAILVGSEGAGVSQALIDSADELITIPMRPPVESLNTAVAASLVLYEAHRRRAG
jgi:TrmH family RNA methyltransferase